MFSDGDSAMFTDAGSDDPAVNITEDVAPFHVLVSSEEKNYTFSGGLLTGTMSLEKTGDSVLTLDNTNTFTGTLSVSAGVSVLSGRLDGPSVVVNDGAGFSESPTGCIAGDVDVTFGWGPLSLMGTNTFTGTLTLDARSRTSGATDWVFTHAGAFGNASNVVVRPTSTTAETRATRLWLSGRFDIPARTLYVGGVSTTTAFFKFGTDSTLSATRSDVGWLGDVEFIDGSGTAPYFDCFAADTTAVSFGAPDAVGETIVSPGGRFRMRGTGTVRAYSRLDIASYLGFVDGGTLEVFAESNVCTYVSLSQGTLRLQTNGALAAYTDIRMGTSSDSAKSNFNAIFDLNGHDQTISRLQEQNVGHGGTRRVMSATEATLTVCGSTDCSFGSASQYGVGTISGALSLVKDGASTWTLTGTNTFTGSVTVKGGTLALGNDAAIPRDATLKIDAGDGSAGIVSIDNGVECCVKYLEIGGEVQKPGIYGGDESPAAQRRLGCFSGAGVLRVRRGLGGFILMVK